MSSRSRCTPAPIVILTALLLTPWLVCLDVVIARQASDSWGGAGDARAAAIVDRAIEVHGGRDRWRSMGDVTFRTTWTRFADGRPSVSARYTITFPIGPGLLRGRVEAEENGKPVVMGLSGLRSWFVVGSERSEDLDVLKANRAFIRQAYRLLALPFRLDEPGHTFHYEGEEVRSAAVVDRVRVEHGVDPPVLLLFDRGTGRLAGVGSPVADPPTSMLAEPRDFAQVNGLLLPRLHQFERVDPGSGRRQPGLIVAVEQVAFGRGLAPELFEPPPAP